MILILILILPPLYLSPAITPGWGKNSDNQTTGEALIESGTGIPGQSWKEPVTGMEFIWIQGGCYQMGSPAKEHGRDSSEGPQHKVCVDGFWMGKYEVTNAQFRKYRRYHNSKQYKGHSLNGRNQPAVYLRWKDAKAYAKWLTKVSEGGGHFRLPTEAEWEYACRGGTRTARFWGKDPDEACKYANVYDKTSERDFNFSWTPHNCKDDYSVTAPVGSFLPNPFGLYDMLGNVWEWCEDIYARDAYAKHRDANPRYKGHGTYMVSRGGCWSYGPWSVRSAFRFGFTPAVRSLCLGFRLVMTE